MTTNTEIDHYDLESRGITSVLQEDTTQNGIDGTGHDSTLVGIYRSGDLKLRVDVRLNFYEFQSHARISVWDGPSNGWVFVANLDTPEIGRCTTGRKHETEQGLRYPDLYQMEELRNRLISLALAVVA